MDNRYLNKPIQDDSELEVLLSLKRNIFKNLKVASLATVKSYDRENYEATVSLFPLYKNEIEVNILVTLPANIMVEQDDIVVVLFLDRNFKQSLKQEIHKQKRTRLDVQNVELHSIQYGIIVANISRENTVDLVPITISEIEEIFINNIERKVELNAIN